MSFAFAEFYSSSTAPIYLDQENGKLLSFILTARHDGRESAMPAPRRLYF